MSLPSPLLFRSGLMPKVDQVGQDLVQRHSHLFPVGKCLFLFFQAIVISVVSHPFAGHFKETLVLLFFSVAAL